MSEVFDWHQPPVAEFAVVGNPVSHSLSPAMHSAAFRALGLSFRYVAIRVEQGELQSAFQSLMAQGYRGLNLTAPFKEEALQFVAAGDEFTRRCGAINTVDLGRMTGINTDAPGFVDTISGLVPPGARVLLLGAGGSARAIALALHMDGYPLTIFNRTRERAESLIHELGLPARLVDQPTLKDVDLIVNATSASLTSETLRLRWDEASPATVAYDLSYVGGPFLEEAKKAGLRTLDGRAMLVAQGVRALRFWLPDVEPPTAAMMEALS